MSVVHRAVIDDTSIETLTLVFWRDEPGPWFIGPVQPVFACQAGPNPVEGSVGFGASPLAALRALCDSIAQDEGVKTDNGKILLR